MKFVNQFDLPVPVEEAWSVLADVPRIAPCLPGATVRELSEDQYAGEVTIKVGPIRAQYQGEAALVQRDEDARVLVLDARGKEASGKGSAAATITLQLEDAGDTSRAVVTTDLSITGRLAQFGRSAMADVSQRLMSQFADNLAGELGAVPNAGPVGVGMPSTDVRKPEVDAGCAPRVSAAMDNELDAMTLLVPVLRRAVPALAAGMFGLALGVAMGRMRGRRAVTPPALPWPGPWYPPAWADFHPQS